NSKQFIALGSLARVVEGPDPGADLDRGEQPCFGVGISGGDLLCRLQRRRLDDDEAAVHGFAVSLGERTGELEHAAEAFEVCDMLWTLRLAEGETVRLVGADQSVEHCGPSLRKSLFPSGANCPHSSATPRA